jgi:hypothetical protein
MVAILSATRDKEPAREKQPMIRAVEKILPSEKRAPPALLCPMDIGPAQAFHIRKKDIANKIKAFHKQTMQLVQCAPIKGQIVRESSQVVGTKAFRPAAEQNQCAIDHAPDPQRIQTMRVEKQMEFIGIQIIRMALGFTAQKAGRLVPYQTPKPVLSAMEICNIFAGPSGQSSRSGWVGTQRGFQANPI